MYISNDILTKNLNNKGKVFLRKKLCSTWEDHNYNINWEGLVFIDGFPSGIESIKTFTKELEKSGIISACRLLKGIFFIIVEDKETGDTYSFVDNSGLFQAFYTNKMLSTSFLELVRTEKYKVNDFDPDAVVEFLYFGNLFFDKTLFGMIKRIPGDKIFYYAHKDGKRYMLDKKKSYFKVSSIDELKSFDEIFEKLAKSLSNRKVSVDLTGGVDSRLIAAMLDYYGLEFETATSGGVANYNDVAISKEVANILGHPWFCTIHSISNLEEDVTEIFYITEGLYNILHYHRMFQMQKARHERGIDTIISGAGGEFFKDTWWLQDFPFYFKRSANIERLVDVRLMTGKPIHSILTKKYSVISKFLRNKIVHELSSQYSLETNIKTYDNICFNFKMKDVAGRELTNHNFYVQTYTPFLDIDTAKIGFNLPVMMRFFNMFHRKELTKIDPLIARIPTTENGISASLELTMMIRDLPMYFGNRLNRLLIKLNLQKFKRFVGLNHPSFYHHAREMNVMKDSLEILKDVGIVDRRVEMKQIEDRYLGNFLSLGMLIDYISSK